MTKEHSIEDKIEEARREGNFTAYVFTREELDSLLEAYAKEQREICADAARDVFGAEDEEMEPIRNAPSPTDKQ